MSFKYLRDPLFIFCLVVYFLNRWLLKPLFPRSFFHDHLNDFICIPFWVPIMLWGLRKMGGRDHYAPPQWYEILMPLVVWSIVFESIVPHLAAFQHLASADPTDILWYALGATGAALFWQKWYEIKRKGQGEIN